MDRDLSSGKMSILMLPYRYTATYLMVTSTKSSLWYYKTDTVLLNIFYTATLQQYCDRHCFKAMILAKTHYRTLDSMLPHFPLVFADNSTQGIVNQPV